MTQRLDYQQQSPELTKKLMEFSMAEAKCAIEESIRHLVHIRASQINGCAFCVDMHGQAGGHPWRASAAPAPHRHLA